jgi:hypothetical protein
MLKLTAAGSYVWSGRVGGTSGDVGNCIVVDGSDNVYLAGYFAGTADFDPQSGTANLTTAGQDDIFFGMYTQSGVGISENSFAAISLYPNPCTEVLQLNLSENSEAVISVYNTAGQLVLSSVSAQSTVTLNTAALENGVYFVEVNQNGSIARSKFVKQ